MHTGTMGRINYLMGIKLGGYFSKWVGYYAISHHYFKLLKNDGGPRLRASLFPLNIYCEWETHPSRSPFHLTRSVPDNSYKIVFDAWNMYHSVPISKED